MKCTTLRTFLYHIGSSHSLTSRMRPSSNNIDAVVHGVVVETSAIDTAIFLVAVLKTA